MSTLNDTALGTNDGSGTTLSTGDALNVTAGDLVVVGVKWEGATTTASIDTGASTPTFTDANAIYNMSSGIASGDMSGVVKYWIATSTGTVTPRVVLGAARTFRKIKAYSFTPAGGTTLELGNVAAEEDPSLLTALSLGPISATAAGVATVFVQMYGTRSLTPGSGWSEATEFNISDAQVTEYRLPTGSGSLTGDGTLSATVDYIGQMAIFNEVALGGGAQNITGSGNIGTAEAFGTAKLNLAIAGVGNIASLEAFGTAKLNLALAGVGGIASGEAFFSSDTGGAIEWYESVGATSHRIKVGTSTGSYTVGTQDVGTPYLDAAAGLCQYSLEDLANDLSLTPGTRYYAVIVGWDGASEGDPSNEQSFVLGSAVVFVHVTPSGVASAEAFGTAQLNLAIAGVGNIASLEAFGSHVVSSGATVVSGAGNIASLEALGSASVVPGGVTVSGAGAIASLEALGTAQLNLVLTGAGAIASLEALGSATVVPGLVTIAGAGAIASGEVVGEALVTAGGSVITGAGNIAGVEAFGTATLTTGPVSITGVGAIASAEALGGAVVQSGQVFIAGPGGIASEEVFGAPAISVGAAVIASAGGIASGEAFGDTLVNSGQVFILGAGGIASEEVFGTALVPGGYVMPEARVLRTPGGSRTLRVPGGDRS